MISRILFTAALFLSACVTEYEPMPPPRPAKVPQTAFWCGGVDGGVFVELFRDSKKKNSFYGTIYYEADGDIWYRGEFRMDPRHPGKPPKRGTSWCGGWDGTRLYLQGGGALISIGPKRF